MTLETVIRDSNQQKDAQSIAVNHLVQVQPTQKEDFGTEVELKTDLTEEEVIIHTICDEVGKIFSGDGTEDFSKVNILQRCVERKERKLLSKGRQSRSEVVAVARAREDSNTTNEGFFKKLFTPRM